MRKKIVITLWISLVILIIAFGSLVVIQNKKAAKEAAEKERIEAQQEQARLEAEKAEKEAAEAAAAD